MKCTNRSDSNNTVNQTLTVTINDGLVSFEHNIPDHSMRRMKNAALPEGMELAIVLGRKGFSIVDCVEDEAHAVSTSQQTEFLKRECERLRGVAVDFSESISIKVKTIEALTEEIEDLKAELRKYKGV